MFRVIWSAVVVVLMLPSVFAQSSKPPAVSSDQRLAALAAAKLNFDDALLKASESVIGGLNFRIELTVSEGKPVYAVQLLVGDPTHHIMLDAADGALLDQHDGASFNRDGAPLRYLHDRPNIGLVAAMQVAEAEYPDMKAYSCEVMVKGQELQYEVRMVADGDRAKHLMISAQGQLLKAGPPPLPIAK